MDYLDDFDNAKKPPPPTIMGYATFAYFLEFQVRIGNFMKRNKLRLGSLCIRVDSASHSINGWYVRGISPLFFSYVLEGVRQRVELFAHACLVNKKHYFRSAFNFGFIPLFRFFFPLPPSLGTPEQTN